MAERTKQTTVKSPSGAYGYFLAREKTARIFHIEAWSAKPKTFFRVTRRPCSVDPVLQFVGSSSWSQYFPANDIVVPEGGELEWYATDPDASVAFYTESDLRPGRSREEFIRGRIAVNKQAAERGVPTIPEFARLAREHAELVVTARAFGSEVTPGSTDDELLWKMAAESVATSAKIEEMASHAGKAVAELARDIIIGKDTPKEHLTGVEFRPNYIDRNSSSGPLPAGRVDQVDEGLRNTVCSPGENGYYYRLTAGLEKITERVERVERDGGPALAAKMAREKAAHRADLDRPYPPPKK
jgi:hypothetical protein